MPAAARWVVVGLLAAGGLTLVAAAQRVAPSAAVTGVGNFSHVVASLDRSVRFYRDALGLQVDEAPRLFSGDAAMRVSNALGAQALFTRLPVPGSPLGVEVIEYQRIERRPARPRFHEAGAAHLTFAVTDLDTAIARIRKTGTALAAGGAAVALGDGRRVALLEDPDGFFVQLVQAGGPGSPVAGPSSPSGFEFVVTDVERARQLYGEALGFAFHPDTSDRTSRLLAAAGMRDVRPRQLTAQIPGTSVTMSLVATPRPARVAMRTRFQDPGTPVLQLLVRDAKAVTNAWTRAGGEVITTGGAPVTLGALTLVVLRDPDNLMIELIEGR